MRCSVDSNPNTHTVLTLDATAELHGYQYLDSVVPVPWDTPMLSMLDSLPYQSISMSDQSEISH